MQIDSTCEQCGVRYTHRYTYRVSRFCSRRCSTRYCAKRVPLAERFWAKVAKGEGCWLWTGSRNKRGYGKISRYPGGMDYAHRVSYELNIGPVPTDMDVRHFVCDNPPCVRPEHLRVGPRVVNMQDAVNRGSIRSGLRHHNVKLTDSQVREIRTRYAAGGVRQAELAAEYGITEPYVSQLVHLRGRRGAGG